MNIREAVSAIFMTEERVFMIRRQPYLKAFPGYHAFPGGKVDREDYDQATPPTFFGGHGAPLIHALKREIEEELAFDLYAAAEAGRIAGFSVLATVTTPEFHRHRFRTHFFLIRMQESPSFEVGSEEAESHGWFGCPDLLRRFEEGHLLVVPPVLNMLRALAQDPARNHVADAGFKFDPQTEVPCLEALGGLWQLPVKSHTLPPADRTNAFVIGEVLVDPSPATLEEKDKLLHVLRRFSLKRLFLTHHHADHYQFAEQIARERKLPLSMSEDTHQRITAKRGAGFFGGLSVTYMKEGDVLTHWNGKDVKVYAVPGHDEGQLGLAPESMEWFLVGDLIQGIGTVVIAAPEGDMSKYFESLQKVIALDPAIIIPSHGIAMGSTYRLKATLAHRKQREEQVRSLFQAGKNKEEMLASIYENLHPGLLPLAMANIEAHLLKLSRERRLA